MEIVFKNVSFVINKSTSLEKTILNDISFSIIESGIYAFVGASNSGKSAIGRLISTLNIPTKGEVKLGKYKSNGKRKGLKEVRSKIGYVYQNPYDMFFNKTVYEELSFGMMEFKYRLDTLKKRVNDALELVGLSEDYSDRDPLSLNLVEARKLSLACTLIYNPKVIILDEITNGLSYPEKRELSRLLKKLKNEYKKIIIILSKDTSFVYEVTDYVYLMYLTKIVKEGKKELLEEYELESINLETPKIISFVKECKKKGHDINYYTNILDLIKGVYRDVF